MSVFYYINYFYIPLTNIKIFLYMQRRILYKDLYFNFNFEVKLGLAGYRKITYKK